MAYVANTDLTDCDREPIHLLGGVQGYGCLIATSFDFLINHVSANVAQLLKLDPDTLVGRPLPEFFPERIVHMLRSNLQFVSPTSGVTRVFACDVLGRGALFDLSIHISGQSYVFEFEPRIDTAQRVSFSLTRFLFNLKPNFHDERKTFVSTRRSSRRRAGRSAPESALKNR